MYVVKLFTADHVYFDTSINIRLYTSVLSSADQSMGTVTDIRSSNYILMAFYLSTYRRAKIISNGLRTPVEITTNRWTGAVKEASTMEFTVLVFLTGDIAKTNKNNFSYLITLSVYFEILII